MTKKSKPKEIEITPEMIEAGVEVLADRFGVVGHYGALEIAEEVFRAMSAIASNSLIDSGYGEEERSMENTSKVEPLKKREVYYYRRRFLNRVFSSLAKFFADEAKSHGATKSMIAKKLGVDPSQIARWLSHPNNLTLENISDLLLAMDAEAEPLTYVKLQEEFRDALEDKSTNVSTPSN